MEGASGKALKMSSRATTDRAGCSKTGHNMD